MDASGTEQGFSYRRVQMNGTTPVKVVALFRQTGTNAISFSNVVTIPLASPLAFWLCVLSTQGWGRTNGPRRSLRR